MSITLLTDRVPWLDKNMHYKIKYTIQILNNTVLGKTTSRNALTCVPINLHENVADTLYWHNL